MISKIRCWKTSDGKLFEKIDEAIKYEKQLMFKKFLKAKVFFGIHESFYRQLVVDEIANKYEEILDATQSISESVERELDEQEINS